MISTSMTINFSSLPQRANELEQLKNQLKTALQQLQQYKNTLGSYWKGESWNVFSQYFTRNQAQFDAFIRGIEQYIQVLRAAINRYELAERRNMDTAKTR